MHTPNLAFWHKYPGSQPEPKAPSDNLDASWMMGFLLVLFVLTLCSQSR